MPNSNTHVTTVATMEASTNGEGLQVESTDEEELKEGNLHEQAIKCTDLSCDTLDTHI